MRRSLLLASKVINGDLIVASNNVRMRVTSVLPIHNRTTVIIYGNTVTGEVGIAHAADEAVVRLD